MNTNNKNMKILGIDYGRSKIGLAIAVGGLAEPLKVIRYKDMKQLVLQVLQVIQAEQVEKVIVGISEGKMAEESKEFAKTIQPFIHSTIDFFDETLTSRDAQTLSIQAGIHQKKRHEMEDAYAATIMLQGYLDLSN